MGQIILFLIAAFKSKGCQVIDRVDPTCGELDCPSVEHGILAQGGCLQQLCRVSCCNKRKAFVGFILVAMVLFPFILFFANARIAASSVRDYYSIEQGMDVQEVYSICGPPDSKITVISKSDLFFWDNSPLVGGSYPNVDYVLIYKCGPVVEMHRYQIGIGPKGEVVSKEIIEYSFW